MMLYPVGKRVFCSFSSNEDIPGSDASCKVMFLKTLFIQVMSSFPLRNLPRRSQVKEVKICPPSPRSYSSTPLRSYMLKFVTRTSMLWEQHLARRPRSSRLHLKFVSSLCAKIRMHVSLQPGASSKWVLQLYSIGYLP